MGVPFNPESTGGSELQRVVHELQVHQIELELQNQELIQAKEEARAALREKTRIYQSLSHDIAQPVLALRLFLNVLAKSGLNQEQHKVLAQAVSSANALGELSAALSELRNEVVTGPLPPHQLIALQPLLESALNDHLPIAAQKGLHARLVPTQATVTSNPLLLRRIVGNLIANAVHQTTTGGVLVGVRRSHANAWRIEVWDTGIGIRQEDQAHVFEEFYQVGNAERNPANGLGLGLSIARRLSESLGCTLDVRSVPGRGSRFSVTIPAGLQ
jgi:signal transduction histidine kinase